MYFITCRYSISIYKRHKNLYVSQFYFIFRARNRVCLLYALFVRLQMLFRDHTVTNISSSLPYKVLPLATLYQFRRGSKLITMTRQEELLWLHSPTRHKTVWMWDWLYKRQASIRLWGSNGGVEVKHSQGPLNCGTRWQVNFKFQRKCLLFIMDMVICEPFWVLCRSCQCYTSVY
jgi:hypothetical protein